MDMKDRVLNELENAINETRKYMKHIDPSTKEYDSNAYVNYGIATGIFRGACMTINNDDEFLDMLLEKISAFSSEFWNRQN